MIRRWLRSRADRRAVSARLRELADFTPVLDLTDDRRNWPGFEDVVERSVAEGLLDDEDPVVRLIRRERA